MPLVVREEAAALARYNHMACRWVCESMGRLLRLGEMRALAAILVLALWPGVAEAVQDMSHWVAEGHTLHASVSAPNRDPAHDPAHDGHDEHEERHGDDEHGCSVLFHLCGCHSPTPSVTSTTLVLAAVEQVHDDLVAIVPEAARRPTDGVRAKAFRPPIA